VNGNSEIPGILVERAVSVLCENGFMPFDDPAIATDGEIGVFTDPVWIPADTIDQLIISEDWKEGHLNDVRCFPPADKWPDRWKGLKSR